MSTPQIIIGGDVEPHAERDENVKKAQVYRDLSTVCVVPTRGVIPARVVESWMNLQTPMNQPFVRCFVEGYEVGHAYEQAVELVRNHPTLKGFRYLLTLEEDNIPPSDGLLRLFEHMCTCRKLCNSHYSIVAGLYHTKGEGGMPMVYGNPKEILKFNPQVVRPEEVQECNGTGMGFTLFNMQLFDKVERPWFKTAPHHTQDLFFMGKVRSKGFRVASDNRVRVGHYDQESRVCW